MAQGRDLIGRRGDFWSKVLKGDGCWLWEASLNSTGYGIAWANGRRRLAHRLSYEMANGSIPDGLTIDHLCRVKCCVRPDHLEAVTHRENSIRAKQQVTHCPRGHEYTPENTYVGKDHRTRAPYRACRTCQRQWAKARTEKLRRKEKV